MGDGPVGGGVAVIALSPIIHDLAPFLLGCGCEVIWQ